MISPTFRRFEVFRTVVEAGGVARAANVLGISQPAVTAHIEALRKHVGQPLFIRRAGMTSVLTEAGERLYTHAVDVVTRADQAAVALAQIRERDHSRLSVAIARSLTGSVFSDTIAEFLRRNAQVRVSIHCGTDADVLQLLRTGVVECAMFSTLGAVDDLDSTVIGSDQLVFTVASDHPLAKARRPTRASFERYCFIGPGSGSDGDTIADQAFRKMRLQRPAVTMDVRESDTIADLVCRGAGTALSPFRRVVHAVESGTLSILDFNRPPLRTSIRWAAAPGKAPSQLSCDLLAFIESSGVFHYPVPDDVHARRVRVY